MLMKPWLGGNNSQTVWLHDSLVSMTMDLLHLTSHSLSFSLVSLTHSPPTLTSCFKLLASVSSCSSFIYTLISSCFFVFLCVPADLTSRPRSPPQPPPLPPGRPPPPTPPQERGNESEVGGAAGGASGDGSGGGVEDWEDRDTPLRQLDASEGEERDGARVPRAVDNQYSFFWERERERVRRVLQPFISTILIFSEDKF